MSQLFKLRYPGKTPAEVLYEYIRSNPGCTRTDMVHNLPSVSHESYLKKLERQGKVRRTDSGPGVRWEAVE